MSFSMRRVRAVMLRNIMAELTNFGRLMDAIYWPTIDIMLWGMTSSWLAQSEQQIPNLVLVIMTGLVFWQIVMRASYEISVGLLEEVWSRSFVTLFSTPLSINEWIFGVMLMGVLKTILVLLFGVGIVWAFYTLNIFSFGWMLIPFSFALIMFGWVVGFLGAAVIVYKGDRVSSLPWVFAFLFAPFSAVYYPVALLPNWLQSIALCLPTSYIFEGMRSVIATGEFPVKDFAMSMGLNAVYLTCALMLFRFMFEKSRARGFDRL